MIWYGADNPETYGWAWYFECWYHMVYLEHYGLWGWGKPPAERKPELGGTSGFGPMSCVQTNPLTGEVTVVSPSYGTSAERRVS